MSSGYDFNGAEAQNSGFDPIPAGTLVKVKLSIRPGGAGPEGWVTSSRSSTSTYLNTEAVVTEGPFARRHIFTRIGVKGKSVNEKGEDTYANRGRALIRGILESARGINGEDQSERARSARTIRSYGDLNGVEFVARVGVEKDRDNPYSEPRNVISAAIGPSNKSYAATMGNIPMSPTMPMAMPGSQPPVTGNGDSGAAPFWAR